ncbi:MAG: glycosyltransferase family 39 protein [Symploca sp. SIO3C6]|uniref:Glycosyltransferase family 39 protein n=1 Tax=Symploca sp. SIO1C4 TaxID=2607765 RepID=A0A6B3N805_9CYAN|nr:glycosyltransferase family 39 protein [Symploca sp. SIO3C6]NER26975.1 glycosyltransferase family 39 protein [Symploca sp. SIO1C4]
MKLKVDRIATTWWKAWQQQPTIAWAFSVIWLLLISWLAFLWHLGSTGLVDETEPLFAEAARQMTVTGDWITPYFNDDTRFDKPPLVYWLMAIGYKLIGVNEWAVRLPSAMAAIALTVLGFYTLRSYGVCRPAALTQLPNSQLDGKVRNKYILEKITNLQQQLWLSAWIGSALIAFNPLTIVWARIGVSDMLLSGCMGCALLSFFLGYAQPEQVKEKTLFSRAKDRWYLAFYILIALAILAKGPVGIVLPAIIIGAFVLYLGNGWDVLREMRPVRGLIIILTLALPWYILVTIAHRDDYLESFFGYHNFERFTGIVNGHGAPWYFYFLVVLVGFAPWSSYLPIAITRIRFWQRKRWQSAPRSTHLGLFALFWFTGIFGFFTIAVTKLPSYVLPLMPAAAILLALLWSDYGNSYAREMGRWGDGEMGRWGDGEKDKSNLVCLPSRTVDPILFSGIFNLILLVVIAAVIFYGSQLLGYDPAAPNLSELLQRSGLPLRGCLIWGATAILTGVLLWRRRWWRWLWSVNLVGLIAFLILVLMPLVFLMDEARQLPLRQLSAIATQVEQPGEELIMIGFEKPSVVFYTQKPVNYFSRQRKAMAHIKKVTLKKPQSSFVILLKSEELKETKLQPNEYINLGSAGAYKLIRVVNKAD